VGAGFSVIGIDCLGWVWARNPLSESLKGALGQNGTGEEGGGGGLQRPQQGRQVVAKVTEIACYSIINIYCTLYTCTGTEKINLVLDKEESILYHNSSMVLELNDNMTGLDFKCYFR
jgi:hypothetical protein